MLGTKLTTFQVINYFFWFKTISKVNINFSAMYLDHEYNVRFGDPTAETAPVRLVAGAISQSTSALPSSSGKQPPGIRSSGKAPRKAPRKPTIITTTGAGKRKQTAPSSAVPRGERRQPAGAGVIKRARRYRPG
jgi:hypothetical protein